MMPANNPTAEWLKLRVNIMPNGCWEWSATRDRKGYGKCQVKGRSMRAHRIAWTIVHGLIPKGLCVLHQCDNPPCCNPAHLFTGTRKDNAIDCVRKGRSVARDELSRQRKAKVTERQVLDIRRRCLIEGEKQILVAQDYKLCQSAVSRIVTNYNWQNLPMPQTKGTT